MSSTRIVASINKPLSASAFDVLDDDIIDLIIEEFLDAKAIQAFSRTCKRIRSRCLPMLFKECSLRNFVPVEANVFYPPSVWPYISALRLNDLCPDKPRPEGSKHLPLFLHYTEDPLICGLYDNPFLPMALQRMPRLRSITFVLHSTQTHGLPWSSIRRILTVPHIREVALHDHRCAPRSAAGGEPFTLESPAPLTSFEHILWDYRSRSETFPSEEQALTLILRGVHTSLQRLTLAIEPAPLHEICTTLEWPNLRELRLRGERRTIGDPPLPIIAMFANMPRLRLLELKLGQPEGVDPEPIWPSEFSAEWRWPDLQELTLSCPQVDDRVYANLPVTLRTLSLRYTPHYMNYIYKGKYGQTIKAAWQFPLLTSPGILQILCQCQLPLLGHLELEYREDDADDELLHHIGSAFPRLTSLKLIRYRRSWQPPAVAVDVAHIAGMLTPLTNLRTVTLHLDLPDTPVPLVRPPPDPYPAGHYTREELQPFWKTLQSVADLVANILGESAPSLGTIRLWRPHQQLVFDWAEYEVVRRDGRARAQLVGELP